MKKAAQMHTKKKIVGQKSSAFFYPSFVALLIAMPLFFVPQTMDKVLMPRLFLLNFFLLVFYSFYIFKPNLIKLNLWLLKNKIFPVFLLLLILTFVSRFWAINFCEGFFDTVKTCSILILLFTMVQVLTNTENRHIKLTYLVVVSALITAMLGLIEYVNEVLPNPDLLLKNRRPVIYLVTGIMGHKNQLSIALMLQLPFLIFGIVRLKKLWRYFAIVSLTLSLLMIFLLETRSVWVALCISSAAIILFIIFQYRFLNISEKIRKRLITFSLVGFLIFAGIVGVSIYSGNKVGKKLQTIANPQDTRNIHRLKVWDFTLRMAMQKPLSGVGAGNWKLEAPRFHHKADFDITESNWLRPHNDFLWILAEKGIFGLLLFISIFLLAFYQAYKIILSKIANDHKIFILLIAGGLIMYVVVSFFTFPLERINHQVYLALFIAIIIATHHPIATGKKVGRSGLIFVIPTLAFTVFGLFYSFEMIKLETHLKKANIARERSKWQQVIDETKQATTPFRNLDPENIPILWYSGSAYNELGKYDLAINHLKKALRISPYNAVVMNNLGQAYFNANEIKKALRILKKALKIYPRFIEANVNISSCYYSLGKYEKAYEALLSIPVRKRSEIIKNNIGILATIIGKEKVKKIEVKIRRKFRVMKK